MKVNHLRFVPVKRSARLAQWPPVCSSSNWQRHEDRHVDLADEGRRVERVRDLRPVEAVSVDLADQIGRGCMQRLVGLADLIAVLDPLVGPALPLGGRGGLRVVDPVLRPLQGEAGVEEAARVERRRGVVDHRQRRDRGKVRWPGRADEELADPSVGDAGHPDSVVEDPGLARRCLDHVIAVKALQRLEVVEGAARAASAAHVHVDHRVAEQVEDLADSAFGAGRVRVAVPRILDQRRIWTVRGGSGQADVEGEAGAVPRGHVAVAAGGQSLVVDRWILRRRSVAHHADPHRERPVGGACPVALAGGHPAEDDAAEGTDGLGRDLLPLAIDQAKARPGLGAGHVDLVDAAVDPEVVGCGRGRGGETDDRQGGRQCGNGHPAQISLTPRAVHRSPLLGSPV